MSDLRRPSDVVLWITGLVAAAIATGIASAGGARLGAALTLGVIVLGVVVVGAIAWSAREAPRLPPSTPASGERPGPPRRATPGARKGT